MDPTANPPLSILIIDKAEGNQLLLKKQLKAAEGWTLAIDCVSDEKNTLKKLGESFYDLIFLDYHLPDADGLETLAKIRQLYEKSAVVMATSSGNENIAVAAMKQGAMDYLTHEELRLLDVRQLFRRLLEIRNLTNQNMELRHINQMKNEFIANVSHELRTPLSVILGYSTTLQNGTLGPLSEGQQKAIETIINRAEGLLLILNQIITIRGSQETPQQVLLRPLELQSWLAQYAAKPHRGLAKKKIKLDIAIPKTSTWIRADEVKLAEALDNLMSNAVKFGPEASRIVLSLSLESEQAHIAIQDEGPGIAPEILPHIFEKMFAAVQGPTRKYAGLGLGLSISQQIVELHTGRIWLESKGPGMGCVAHVTLPLSSADSRELLVERPAELQKKRILIVEDNPDLIEVLKLFLSGISPNLEIAATTSGFEALESIKEKKPDLMLLDVMMPGMSGLEVIARLRRVTETAKIPIMVLTGYQEGANMALQAGAQEVLLKPFDKNSVIKKVLRLLQEDPSSPQIAVDQPLKS